MRKVALVVVSGLAATTAPNAVQAAEDATGIYLLGFKTSMAGYVPPPGTYVSAFSYYYNGDASGGAAVGRALRGTGSIKVQADVALVGEAFVEAPVLIWVAPEKVFGGNIGFGAIASYGRKTVDVDLDVRANLTLPNGTQLNAGRHFDIDDGETNFGDPQAMAMIGWHQGNWHWSVSGLLNIPIGQWDEEKIANMGVHRWAFDFTPAITWLDPGTGFEISTAAGFTFNGTNLDVDYKTGTEFHVEWAVMKRLSKTFAIGLAGYHYQQVTGDSGSAATTGDFEGRVTALGPDITYSFLMGKIPVSTELKYFREFDVENRVEGDAGMFSVTMPLSAAN